ncbi:MAG: DUF2292 domain-containing protein [Candidatus Kuenenia sp.]|nr:DUF2292 domain-containing protein [Candidatus Kuenenia sp.]
MDGLDKEQEQEKDKEMLNLLKGKKAYPESGFGSITVNLHNHKITHLEKKETIKT